MLERLIKARNKKGFTLVELIVVLVIMALLAAVLVPSLIGWINKAKQQTHAAEARAAYTSAVALQTERWASQGSDISLANEADDIKALAGVPGKITALTIDGKHEVSAITYTAGGYNYAMAPALDDGGAGETTVTPVA